MLGIAVSLVLCVNPYLAEGKKHFESLEFDAAARSFAVAVEQNDLTVDELRTAFEVWAQALLALNRREEAERVFVRWLKKDPYAPAPNAAPKVVDAFLRARQLAWPRPSVKWSRLDDVSGSVRVELFDPWNLASRVRWLEQGDAGLVEQPTPTLETHVVTVQPSVGSRRLLFDALDGQGVLLAHLEVPMVAATTAAVAAVSPNSVTRSGSQVKWAPIVLLIAGAISAGVGITFLAMGFRAAPTFTSAGEINQWNQSTSTQAAVGWSLLGIGTASAGLGGVLFAF